jgi:Family of unknown function (DUF6459)
MTQRHVRSTAAVPVPIRRRWMPEEAAQGVERSRYTQGSLALSFPLPTGLDAEPASTALTIVSERSETANPAPDPRPWVARFLQAVVEVVASERPLTQLVRWTHPDVFAEISWRRQRVAEHRGSNRGRSGRQVVATVHITRPQGDVAEVAARVTTGPRSRAVAVRLDYQRGRWLCTAISFG